MSAIPRSLRAWWHDVVATPRNADTERFWAAVRSSHPPFLAAVAADARVAASHRGERHEHRSRLDSAVQVVRLALVADAFLAQVCYRAKAACQAKRIPVVPRLLHRAAIVTGQIAIGDPVVVEAGVYIPHGQVVIDGMTRIRTRAMVGPFVSIGLVAGDVRGPTIEAYARIGTGARILGPLHIGARSQVGAGAVVTADVPAGTTVVGVPARVIHPRRAGGSERAEETS